MSIDYENYPFTIKEHVVPASHIREYSHATRHSDSLLRLSVKQYTPKDNPNPSIGDVTFIISPGVGLFKVKFHHGTYTLGNFSK